MRLKSFSAASLPEAMKAVRAHFGPDAVILSTVNEGSDGQVRVTAALEEDGQDGLVSASSEPDVWNAIDGLAAALSYHRVPQGLLDRLLEATPSAKALDLAMAGALDTVLSLQPFSAKTVQRPLLMIGSPGAGKTSSAAKLSVLAKLAGRQTTLITMDGAKAGGRDQIAVFAQALQTELLEAKDAESLARVIDVQPEARFIVIDTPGANAFNQAEVETLGAIAEAANAEPVLVLPAGGDALDSAEIAQAFSTLGSLKLIATKLDAARRLGGVLSAAFAANCTIIAGGVAPQIAGGMVPLNPVALARLMLLEGSAPTEDINLSESLRAAR